MGKYIKIGNNIVDAIGIKSIKFDLIYIGGENDNNIIRCMVERYDNNSTEIEQYKIYTREVLEELCSEIQRAFNISTSAELILAELEGHKDADLIVHGKKHKQEKIQPLLS